MENNKELAAELLYEAFEQWLDDARRNGIEPSFFFDSEEFLWLEYDGISKHGFGQFQFEYNPQNAAENLINRCHEIVENFKIKAYLLDEKRTVEVYLKDQFDDEQRAKFDKDVARLAIFMLITSIRIHIGEAISQAFDDGLLLSEVAISSVVASNFKESGLNPNADIRIDIAKAAKKAAKIRKETISALLKTLPNILVSRESGRPKESLED